MIISVDEENTFDKIQLLLLKKKNSHQIRNRKKLSQPDKGHLENLEQSAYFIIKG